MSKEIKMKKCKECGEMFTPKSPQQKYCDKDHYRPCPACSKPVFAKYLSDPARCCSGKCQYVFGLMNKNKKTEEPKQVPVVEETQTAPVRTKDDVKLEDVKKYVGEDSHGYVSGHMYEVSVTELGRGSYSVDATYDVTDDKEVKLFMPFTNKKVIAKMFKSVKTL